MHLGNLGQAKKNANLSKNKKTEKVTWPGILWDRKQNVVSSESKWREMRFDK